jgi:hypothetical protein
MINTNKLQLLSGQFIFPAVDKHQGGFSVTRPARPLVDSSVADHWVLWDTTDIEILHQPI